MTVVLQTVVAICAIGVAAAHAQGLGGAGTVQGIVKGHGGFVLVSSEVGKGTSFGVYLPRHIVEHEEEIAQPREKKKEACSVDTGYSLRAIRMP